MSDETFRIIGAVLMGIVTLGFFAALFATDFIIDKKNKKA